MFTGKTKNLGVMGWPVEHSLSPAMQNAALEKAGLDYAYIALPVPPENLEKAVEGMRVAGFCGWNVTIPHKTAIVEYLDDMDSSARMIGAVNTVVNVNGRLKGFNTDAAGFLRGLEQSKFDVAGKRTVLLGAGGAAKAVIWGLCQAGASSIAIGVRNPEKAELLADIFRDHVDVKVFNWETEGFHEALRAAELLVNTTPLGMEPKVDGMPPIELNLLPKEAMVYDIIYTPAETRLLREAKSLGYSTVNGEYMLAGQGAEAFRMWTGKVPDESLMRRVLRESLNKNS